MITRTGWEDVDALFEQAESLKDELEEIQKEAADILYPEGKKPADTSNTRKSLKHRIIRSA
ncbi:DUF5320 domain-containing protein (plasmid) [Paenibacillus rhizovicinus]|uniref:DUF5320 domain-containing protein n=1 Tax=Paenibacillus rhizovicinus TaxID=2704463 RepID=A0A6C0PAD2_9BACL|nr:DUF5320 domain-containing protein [Paenibacillus rhizovicinus]QHW35550.1 DUF5320 domain-containing protein [Paenibacillus rhizovicinus]